MKPSLRVLLSITLLTLLCAPAEAQFWTGSQLLLPYFEVELDNAETRTVFAITNTASEAVTVRASIYSNWGILVLDTDFGLEAHDVITVDLYKWLGEGDLPDRMLSDTEVEHVRAVLCGEPSTMNALFYAEEVSYHLAVGYVLFEVVGGPEERDVLMGDYFLLKPGEDYAQGQAMPNMDPAACGKICFRHGLRFLSGGFSAGTEVFVWTRVEGQPSEDAYYPDADRVHAEVLVYDEEGQHIDTLWLDLLPVQFLKVGELALPEEFGWFDIRTDELSYLSVRYSAFDRFSVGLKTFCLRDRDDLCPDARIRLEKFTNGVNADSPPGPAIPIGMPVLWEYVVTNVGEVTLTDIVVTDNHTNVDVICPFTELAPGVSMTCRADGTAVACQYANIGTVTATSVEVDDCPAQEVQDSDPSHYFGTGDMPGIKIEKATRDGAGAWHDADFGSGPEIAPGAPVAWRYVVENTGNLPLTNVVVTDSQGVAVNCMGVTSLAPNATMTCTGSGVAPNPGPYEYENIGRVLAVATGSCGQTFTVSDSDPSHYHVPSLPPLRCPFGRVFVIQDHPGLLYGSAALSNPNPTAMCTLGMEVNNLGYRMTDDQLYGLELYGEGTAGGNTGKLVRIHPGTCALTELEVQGLPSNVRFDAGDISRDGKWLYVNCAGNENLYRIDLSPIAVDYPNPPGPGDPPKPTLQAEPVVTSGTGTSFGRVNDWAIHPDNNGLLFGGDRDDGQVARLKWDGSKWVRTDYDVANLPADGSTSSSYSYGGVLFDSAGKLVLHRNNGETYRIAISSSGIPAGSVANTDIDLSACPSVSGHNDAAYCMPLD